MARDPETLAHVEWLGYVQPVGLVVSIPALLSAQAHINRNILPDHQRFLACLPHDKFDEPIPELRDFAEFTRTVLGWRESDLEKVMPGDERFASLEIPLPEYHETLRPTHVIREIEPKDASRPWMLLVQVLPTGTPLDDLATSDDRHWQAAPHAKFERLLRETQVPIGLLVNGTSLRLVYAPRGESSGYLTFSVAEMVQVAGRSIFAALHMLFCEERLFSLGEKQRLPAILADSRKYQNHVSNELAQQVLAALYELLRGFQAADEATKGELLRAVLAENPNHVYNGLLTVLMRLVFVLYAEDRGLLSSDPVYANYYSVTGLFERLRADAGRFSDTMDQRYGGWAQLLTLFRLIFDGGSHGGLSIPARKGYLFDPDRYNFLEGRDWRTPRRMLDKAADVPRVSDGVIFRVLNNLLILDGERLSYRTLDVEQIGSVYETMMGFGLEVAQGRSIALKPKKSHGAPTTINLEVLLTVKSTERNKWLKANTDQELSGQAATALKDAAKVEDLLAALDKRIAKNVTPNIVAKGTMVFQPSDERRRSGSHYTPRSLTEPIVRTTLRPILEQLGPQPAPDQILALKICDPAMGSGAFLVEVCRQLGDELVKAWRLHSCLPKLPPDEDELLHARRLIAQRCLYGVDKNPMAVDLSKLSLWLATLAKDHPFTFVDHALRCGDSLVGLTREQIAAFHWQPSEQKHLLQQELTAQIARATEARRKIISAPESVPYADQQQALAVADEALDRVRRIGDLVIAAFFSADKPRPRETRLNEHFSLVARVRGKDGRAEDVAEWIRIVNSLNSGDHPIQPFHWQIEFPEVITVDAKGKPTGGFDAIVGNPPFMGGRLISGAFSDAYLSHLLTEYSESGGQSDLVAYFFRRSFGLLRTGGTFGLVATNTIAQGDTRNAGLLWIRNHSGHIYAAVKRLKWPGAAAVVVSLVHVIKGLDVRDRFLDGKPTSQITAFLFDRGPDAAPAQLENNSRKSFKGMEPYGHGFLFDDDDPLATPITTMQSLIAADPRNSDRIFPYIGGEEILGHPRQEHRRYAISFGAMTEEEARRWPDLISIVANKVKPERSTKAREVANWPWWQYWRHRHELNGAIEGMTRILAHPFTSANLAFSFLPQRTIVASPHVVFAVQTNAAFATMQCRVHETWTRFFASSMKDDLRYTPSDCFETFPFPNGVLEDASGEIPITDIGQLTNLETVGREYYGFRAALMVRNNEGLTKTYNRFHDPDERSADILQLRELHAAMDRAVLEAYGWQDLAQTATCEFLLDYEEDEDDEETSSARRRKKPWRYRWPDNFRDEVLARLLALNAERAEKERLAGIAAKEAHAETKKPARKPRKPAKPAASDAGGLFERERERFYILMLLRAWNRAVTRHALDAGLILMLNDDIRAGVRGTTKPTKKPKATRIVEGLDYLLQEMETLGHITIDNSGPQQVLAAVSKAPPTDPAPDEDLTRIQEVKEYFERERARGNVTESKEHIDAKPDLVPA